MNDLQSFANIFKSIKPWCGYVHPGYQVDFLGIQTDARWFGIDPSSVGGNTMRTKVPVIADGESWFEAVNWAASAMEACNHYVMVTLGARHGTQAVGSYRMLQLLNPMPCKLVLVEAEPDHFEWTKRHLRYNGIDPDLHWLVPHAVSDRNQPVMFPVGAPSTGAQNCFSTNEPAARASYASEIIARGNVEETLLNVVLNNTTGIVKDLLPGQNAIAEIKIISAITLQEILGPFDRVDYLESDIQQSEILVFPPFMDLLKRKVRRIHIGTHGKDVHRALYTLFRKGEWKVIFNYEPDGNYSTPLGDFTTCDGVLTVRNPYLP